MNEFYKLLAIIGCILLGITLSKMQPVELSATTSTSPKRKPTFTPKPHSEETTNVHPTR